MIFKWLEAGPQEALDQKQDLYDLRWDFEICL